MFPTIHTNGRIFIVLPCIISFLTYLFSYTLIIVYLYEQTPHPSPEATIIMAKAAEFLILELTTKALVEMWKTCHRDTIEVNRR